MDGHVDTLLDSRVTATVFINTLSSCGPALVVSVRLTRKCKYNTYGTEVTEGRKKKAKKRLSAASPSFSAAATAAEGRYQILSIHLLLLLLLGLLLPPILPHGLLLHESGVRSARRAYVRTTGENKNTREDGKLTLVIGNG